WGMVLATVVTFFWPGMSAVNIGLIIIAILLGGGLAWWTGKKVAMTDMPQMIALYNGMGGGAAGAIAAVTLYKGAPDSLTVGLLAVLGGLIGSVSFSGSLIAFAKLQGWMTRPIRFKSINQLNAALLLGAFIIGMFLLGNYSAHSTLVTLFF